MCGGSGPRNISLQMGFEQRQEGLATLSRSLSTDPIGRTLDFPPPRPAIHPVSPPFHVWVLGNKPCRKGGVLLYSALWVGISNPSL